MPHLVNGQLVPEDLIREEFGRIGRDPQWMSIADLQERANRLLAAAEQCAQDRILIEQAATNDPRPIEPGELEREVAQQIAQWGCRAAFDRNELRRLTERNLRVGRIRQGMVAGAIQPTVEEMEAFYNTNRANFPRPEMFHASHIVKYVNHEQSEEQAEAGIEAALEALECGEPFAEVADRHSDCKDKGGDLGTFPAGHMVEEFEEEIRALEPGLREDVPNGRKPGVHVIAARPTRVVGEQSRTHGGFEDARLLGIESRQEAGTGRSTRGGSHVVVRKHKRVLLGEARDVGHRVIVRREPIVVAGGQPERRVSHLIHDDQ